MNGAHPIVPKRVLVNKHGRAVAPHLAWAEFGIKSDIIFIRDDGWALGSPLELQDHAYALWRDHWLYWCKDGESQLRPMSTWKTNNGKE